MFALKHYYYYVYGARPCQARQQSHNCGVHILLLVVVNSRRKILFLRVVFNKPGEVGLPALQA